MLISDRDILKKISIEGEKEIQRIAKEKLKDIKALEAIVKNKDKSIQARFEAAKEIEEKYGDLEPKRELQKLGKPGPGRHILYPTVYKEWEKVEYICLRCGKIGGREDDSESTSHYGCNFNEVGVIKNPVLPITMTLTTGQPSTSIWVTSKSKKP